MTISINGVAVPKEKAIAFIHFGHSNMAGRAGMPPTSRPYFFMDIDPQAVFYKQGAFHPALEPFTAGDSMNNSPYYSGEIAPLAGPGTAIVKEAHAMAPSYYFISLGHGTASSYCSQYLPGHLYYDTMMTEPKALLGKVTFGGIFVMLGITERHGTQADINGYAQCINTLIMQIRTDLKEPNLPLLLTDYEMMAQDLPPTASFGMQIIPQIHMVPSIVTNSALVPTDNLVMDKQPDHHFDLEGHRVWSQRALDIMKQKCWFPWSG
jgi:hypothetical protein